jgi:hypothetical protein
MKFRRIPVTSEITAERFNGEDPKVEGIQFRTEDGYFWEIHNELHDSWIKIREGDYYRTDIKGDHYPIDADYMKKNYEEVN